MTKVLLVDDSEIIRKVTRQALSKYKDIKIVGECCDGKEVCEFLETNDIDVILMDINMTYMSGIQATRLVKQKHPHIEVIAMTSNNGTSCRDEMFSAGACAYLNKGTAFYKIKRTIKKVIEKKPDRQFVNYC